MANACQDAHPVELWVLINGDVIACSGLFMQTDEEGNPQATANLPDSFVGVVRTGAAVRGFFADDDGEIHTFLTSIKDWAPFVDRPSSARVILDVPTTVAPCQRRRGKRHGVPSFPVQLGTSIRGEKQTIPGKLVNASSNGIAVRMVRNTQSWFGEGTPLDIEVNLPNEEGCLPFTGIVSRVTREALHYLYGLRVRQDAQGRHMLGQILDQLV